MLKDMGASMQDKQVAVHTDQALLIRSQRMAEQLKDLLQNRQAHSFETLNHMLLALPTPYKAMGLDTIAELLVTDMKLHFLEIVAAFHQSAEQEGIDADERDETLQDSEVDAFRLMQVSKQLAVRSLDDLLTLGNITFGLRALSKVRDAENAQSWLYKLPTMYLSRIEQEHLVTPQLKFEVFYAYGPTEASTWASVLLKNATIYELKVPEVQARRAEGSQNWTHVLTQSSNSISAIRDGVTPTVAG